MAADTIPSAGGQSDRGVTAAAKGWSRALLGSELNEFLKLDPGQLLKEITPASLRPGGNSCTHTAGWTDGCLLT